MMYSCAACQYVLCTSCGTPTSHGVCTIPPSHPDCAQGKLARLPCQPPAGEQDAASTTLCDPVHPDADMPAPPTPTPVPHLGGHKLQRTLVRKRACMYCQGCSAQIRRGVRRWHCVACQLEWCNRCYNNAAASAPLPSCTCADPAVAAEPAHADDVTLDVYLELWVARPAPRTLLHVPRSLKRRVADIFATLLHGATTATRARRAVPVSSPRHVDLCQDELRAHRLLWSFASLLLRCPTAADGDAAVPGRDGALYRQRLIQRRVQQWEQGHLERLLEDALVERDVATANPGADARRTPSQAEQLARRQIAAARKAKNGCLRTAAQLLLDSAGKAPPTHATVSAVWEKVAAPPPSPDLTEAAWSSLHRSAGTDIRSRNHIPPRQVRSAIFTMRAGAEPGASGLRNSLWRDLLQADDGLRDATTWVDMWAQGHFTGPAAELWQRSVVLALTKPKGGIRPICLQETGVKLVERCLLDSHWTELQQALGPRQLGAGRPGGAQIALELLRATSSDPSTAEMISTDFSNAFGTVFRENVIAAAIDSAPWITPYLASAWPQAGTVMFTMGPEGWTSCRACRGVPQGSPLSDKLFSLAFETLLRTCGIDDLLHRICYVDDLTMWGRRSAAASAWPAFTAACAHAGLELNASKCAAWRPHDESDDTEIVPGIAPTTGLTVLGGQLHDTCSWTLGAPEGPSPTATRADKACQLAQAVADFAVAKVDDRGLHAAFTLLQKVVCPALEWDLRVADNAQVEPHCRRVTDAIAVAFQRMLPTLPALHVDAHIAAQLSSPADLAGFALRPPSRVGGAAAARWAALHASLGEAKQLASAHDIPAVWAAADASYVACVDHLAALGVDVSSGTPTTTPDALHALQACPPTCRLLEDMTLDCPRDDRPRLQGRAGRLLDLVGVARLWPTAPTAVREAIDAQTAPGEGALWSDTSTDDREGWLADHHFAHAFLTRMALPVCAPGHRCMLTPASGARQGMPCCRTLDQHGRHTIDGACRSGGIGTRLHNALRRRLARSLREAGLRADEEVVLPELTTVTAKGIQEGRMDIVVVRPGGVTRHLLDLRTVDARAASYADADAAFHDADLEKARRYHGRALAVPVEHRGRLGPAAVEALWVCAQEAALLTGARSASLIRQWRRQLALVAAFELAETLRSSALLHRHPCT